MKASGILCVQIFSEGAASLRLFAPYGKIYPMHILQSSLTVLYTDYYLRSAAYMR